MRSHTARALSAATFVTIVIALGCGAGPAEAHKPTPVDPFSSAFKVNPTSTVSTGRNEGPIKPTPGVVTPRSSTSSRTPWWSLVLVGFLGLAAGAVGGYAVRRRSAPRHADVSAATVPAATVTAGPSPSKTDGLEQLIEAVIAARDLVAPSSVMAQRLGAALAQGGVAELAPVGQAFDPARHHAVQVTPTSDPSNADRIAEVQRIGYSDAHHLIRPPEVVVYRLEAVG